MYKSVVRLCRIRKRFHSVRKSSFHLPFRIRPLTIEAKITEGEKVSANSKLNITNSWSYHLISKHHYSKAMTNTFVNCLINKYKSFPYFVTQFFFIAKWSLLCLHLFFPTHCLCIILIPSLDLYSKEIEQTVNFSNF